MICSTGGKEFEMIDRRTYREFQQRSLQMLEKAGIVLSASEKENIEVADFGLNDLAVIGLELVTYINTNRVCAKELVLLPGQTCPEHRHPSIQDHTGKEETFRCRWGEVYLYVPGEPAAEPKAYLPDEFVKHVNYWHEIILRPGEQYTLLPDTTHWFQGGPNGAVVSEFSTHNDDASDIFSDPRIIREPIIEH
jgi:D-lyxose ketol-isomerase